MTHYSHLVAIYVFEYPPDGIEFWFHFDDVVAARAITKRFLRHMQEQGLNCWYASHMDNHRLGLFEVVIQFDQSIPLERILDAM